MRRHNKSRDAGLYCSRACAFHAQSLKAEHRAYIANEIALIRKLRSLHLKSLKAKALAAKRHQSRIAGCAHCRRPFIRTKKWQRVCSRECWNLARKEAKARARLTPAIIESRKRSKRIYKAMRRARIGAIAERIDPIKVFERDGWRCKLCLCATPQSLRGSHAQQAPEMDHIIPLCKGGHHSWSNVQCLCRKCNGLKGGELQLLRAG